MNDLADLRQKIDDCDDEILKLLVKRFNLVDEVKQFKSEQHLPAMDEKRWQEILEKIRTKAKTEKLDADGVSEIYEAIHKYALKYIYED